VHGSFFGSSGTVCTSFAYFDQMSAHLLMPHGPG
jgi:hypothetical protein